MAISDDILTYIKTQLAVNTPELDVDTPLGSIVDSTAVMEIVVWMEGEYGFDVEIDDIVPDNFGSVAKLAAYVERRKKG